MQRRVSKQNTMKPQTKSSPAARALIQRFEPYRELAAQGSDGHWRVGFGHRAAAREGVRVSRDDASLLLIYDVMQAEAAVDEIFPARLPDSQRDALTSFVHDIGPAAFRNSDVARYMFEGRIEAAAEALASFGEGNASRREAESAMILAGLAPERAAGRKPALVDVEIKVEHPADSDQPVVAARPALPGSIMPPPAPPVLSRQLAARREAEQEIARILATVGAMPREVEAPQPETHHPEPASDSAAAQVSEPVSEHAPDPVPEPEAETPAEPVSQPEPVHEPANESAEEAVAALDGDETGQDAATTEQPVSNEPAEPADLPDDPEPVTAPVAPPASAQVIARMSQEIAQVQTGITGQQASDTHLTPDADALPEGVTLGYVFARSMSASLVLDSSIENRTDTDEPSTASPEEEAAVAPDAETVEAEPELGPRLEDLQSDETAAELEDGSESDPDSGSEAPSGAESLLDGEAESDIEPEIEPESNEAADAGPDSVVHAAAAIVERTLAVTGERTPPPHPSDTPAPSAGAVGDIAGEGGSEPSGGRDIAHLDELADMSEPLDAGDDDDDAFSPRDLVGESDMFIESKPVLPPGGEDGWGFLATLIAGLVVAGAGGMDIYGDWPRVWVERDPTWGVLAAVGGTFLAVTAGWMLSSVLAAKRRDRRAG
tara:strand:+ start:2552 stop:4540 length:1989 start_codon:yes stop_codon:yes gene_type:complete